MRRLFSRESHIPERAQETRSALAGASPWSEPSSAKPPRPCLLLAEPEPLDVLAEIPEGPPARFTWRRVTRRVVKAEGPERIAPEWWRELVTPSPGKGEGSDGHRPSAGGGPTASMIGSDPHPGHPPFRGRERRARTARLLPHRGRGRPPLLGVPRRPLSGERREGPSRLVSARRVRVMARSSSEHASVEAVAQ